MKNKTKRLTQYFCVAIVAGCALLVASPVQAQVIYSINSATVFGDNAVNSGTTGFSFADNMDGTFTLANASDSGNNNAVFINSSDGGSISTLLGRALTASDVVTVSGIVSVADVDYRANGVEFGLHSDAVFRTDQAPNLLSQIDADAARGGIASFYGATTPGPNINRAQTPGVTEDSLNDGYSFEATYSATDIVYTVSDVITTNETGEEPVGATTYSYSLSEAVAADPDDADLSAVFDDYVANYSTIVGNSFAYFSHQNSGTETFSTLSNFEISVSDGGTVLLGDANCDGTVDFLDITPFIALLSNGDFKAQADVNGSGEVDFLDITPFIAILSGQ